MDEREIAEKSLSSDRKKMYNHKPWVSPVKKRGGSGNGDGENEGGGCGGAVKRKLERDGENVSKKKSKKVVLLSSLSPSPERKSEKNARHVKSRSNSKVEDLRGGVSGSSGGSNGGGFSGISLSLSDGVNIPKRRRNFIGRKKVKVEFEVEVPVSLEKEGKLSDGGVLSEGGKVNGDVDDSGLSESQNLDGDLFQNRKNKGFSNGSVEANGKRKYNAHDLCNGNDNGNGNGNGNGIGDSVRKNVRKNLKKNKVKVDETKQSMEESSMVFDDSQDDEENLEANAARMLSSRFDPSCTGFPFGGKSSKLPALMSPNRDFALGCPRDKKKVKGRPKERRRFYAVVYKDLDPFWVLNRRIKVFWPLDKSWYIGHVVGYEQEKNFHHVKYDDREEEWIDLQNERFKLFVFPSEVPGKGGNVRQIADSEKEEKHGETDELAEMTNGSSMESEPIISWLARSSLRKPTKKKRTVLGCLQEGSSGFKADETLNKAKPIAENDLSDNEKAPIVYFRRRFHRKKEPPSSVLEGEMCQLSENPRNVPGFVDSIGLDSDMSLCQGECGHPTKRLSSDELIWDTDYSGVLKLIFPVKSLKVSGFDLCSHLPCVTSNVGGWLSHMFMLKHGNLISMWPLIHLEILIVDDITGLQFLLFEGCMKEAVSFIFLILDVFCQSGRKDMQADPELPVTSIGFRFSGLHEKQLIFTYYNFSPLANSKWSFLDKKLKKHSIFTTKLLPSEYTFDNISALQNGCSRLSLTNVTLEPSAVMNLWKQSMQHASYVSSWQCAKLTQLAFDCDEKLRRLPSFALSCAAAPTFFLSLHLRLLMERSTLTSGFRDQDLVYSMDHPENVAVGLSPSLGGNPLVLPSGSSAVDTCPIVDLGAENVFVDPAEDMITKPSYSSRDFPENDNTSQLEKGKAQLCENEQRLSAAQSCDADNLICEVDNRIKGGHFKGMSIDTQSFDPVAKNTDTNVQNIQHTIDLVLDTNDGDHGVCSPNPTTAQSLWGGSKNGNSFSLASANLSPGWVDRKQDFLQSGFGHGSKKPRTQVSYSLPLGGKDYSSKSKFHHSKGFSLKRIRRASEKKTPETYGTFQRNIELGCEANVLVTVGDRGWREFGAKVVLELFHHNEWRLAVKNLGDTRYSYKAHQFVQSGTTNRYTHAMMWRGGKDWILEFIDRSQWITFKEMHEECYNRNLRAASVKNIPIPGVRLIEEEDNVPEIPYMRPSSKYHCQYETDIDIAMDCSRVLYDMDSDDERWIMKHRGLDFNESGCGNVSDEMFERTIDVLEKLAYAQQRDDFTLDELEEAMCEIGSLEAIKIIYEHWREKRHKKGMPLVRHLQPPLWEKYQQQVKEWEQAVAMTNLSLTGGWQEKPVNVEKPPMFAFCLKPRGLEMPSRGSKQRSQKKLSVGALSNGIPGDSDAYHSQVGRGSNCFVFGDDRFVYPAYNQGTSDSSPVLQGLTRGFSPRDLGAAGYFSLSSNGYEKNRYPKLHRNKSKKLSLISSSIDQPRVASYIQRTPGKKSSAYIWSSSEWPSQMHYQFEGFRRHRIEGLDPAELDEFRLRDASSAARHAKIIAKMKRERARRMLCRADLAKHKAATAIMTAEAVETSYRNLNSDLELSG